MNNRVNSFLELLVLLLAISCVNMAGTRDRTMEYATLLDVGEDYIVSTCPYDGKNDTLWITKPLERVVCMSTSHVAYFDALDRDSVICGVSGTKYVSSPGVCEAIKNGYVKEVGYDMAPDYETIISLKPDVVLAYRVSAAESPFLDKLKSLRIKVFTLYEFLEDHPLGRAEYIKAFGLISGHKALADTLFKDISRRHNSLICSNSDTPPVKVLMNIPYGDTWYIPGSDNYMSRLIKDAGGEVIGAAQGQTSSKAISLEEAYLLASDADCWLNTGWCRTRQQLSDVNPLFSEFKIDRIYNNIRRIGSGGGNDFWESGYVRPDLILADLRAIFDATVSGRAVSDSLTYYVEVK